MGDIIGIHDGVGMTTGGWFSKDLCLNVSNDATTLLRLDWWVANIPLRDRFHRLFDLSANQLSTVADMFDLGWGEGGEAWKWMRRLWAWEEELVRECIALLLTVSLQVDIHDVFDLGPFSRCWVFG